MANSKKSGIRLTTKTKIEIALREIIDDDPTKFKLNMKQLERRSGISRTTLYSDDSKKVINDYLKDDSEVAIVKKKSQSEIESENAALKRRLVDMTSERNDLLIRYSELFTRIYADSAYLACLPDAIDEGVKD